MQVPPASSATRSSRQRSLRRRFNRWASRVDLYPRVEIAVGISILVLGFSSYAVLTGQQAPPAGFSPTRMTLLLVANLLPLMVFIVLIARRLAIVWSNRRAGRAGARLHVRLVALFAVIAAVPTLLVVVFASLLFQFGIQFWFSDRTKSVFENSDMIARAYFDQQSQRLSSDLPAMATDIEHYGHEFGFGSQDFQTGLLFQLRSRHLTAGSVFTPSGTGYRTLAIVNTGKPFSIQLQPQDISHAKAGEVRIIAKADDRIEAVIRIDDAQHYLYVSMPTDPRVLAQLTGSKNARTEYRSLLQRTHAMQQRFSGILIVISLLILAAAIWFALWLANRIVSPIGRLALAAEKVGAGDLDARVPVRGSPDEIGTLARAFNRMTGQLKAQQNALVTANQQLTVRRQFTEAVLSGVSAGVLSIDANGLIRLANHSAVALLEASEAALTGSNFTDSVPELAGLLERAAATGHATGQVVVRRGTETLTLAAEIAAETGGSCGYVITFDDITARLADQRQAAWADVARRIAHEIKNPLTPIQLSAERLQRKYARQITDDPDTFGKLTGTIVRQVGDLRRMVDEFSLFAQLPKPVFKLEPLAEIARQALFLQEVEYPGIAFSLELPDAVPLLVCDRRQLSQALTNVLKNAAEAVSPQIERLSGYAGSIKLRVAIDGGRTLIEVTDNGIGLPVEQRDRLTEPYVTTRARGTGLGLAIVKKIVEEHAGGLELTSAASGGTIVRLCFNDAALAAHLSTGEDSPPRAQRQG